MCNVEGLGPSLSACAVRLLCVRTRGCVYLEIKPLSGSFESRYNCLYKCPNYLSLINYVLNFEFSSFMIKNVRLTFSWILTSYNANCSGVRYRKWDNNTKTMKKKDIELSLILLVQSNLRGLSF